MVDSIITFIKMLLCYFIVYIPLDLLNRKFKFKDKLIIVFGTKSTYHLIV